MGELARNQENRNDGLSSIKGSSPLEYELASDVFSSDGEGSPAFWSRQIANLNPGTKSREVRYTTRSLDGRTKTTKTVIPPTDLRELLVSVAKLSLAGSDLSESDLRGLIERAYEHFREFYDANFVNIKPYVEEAIIHQSSERDLPAFGRAVVAFCQAAEEVTGGGQSYFIHKVQLFGKYICLYLKGEDLE